MKKFISLLVVAAFALSFLPVAKADTLSDLTAQIAALQAQIIALQGDTSTATFCWHANLKYGMRTADVKLLQEKLGVSNTGYFGVLTLAAVKNFQALNGVPATGFVGELTRAQLNLKFCLGTPPTTIPGVVYPAGCTSSVGYSSTTGVLCATGVVAYPAGCTSAVGYSITTGLSCATAVTYPAGCTSAVGFSPTTGVSCATGVAVGAPTEGSLTLVSAPVATITSVGPSEVKDAIMAFGVKAKDSTMSIKRVDVRLTSASALPWKYFTSIYLYQDSTLIATLPVTSTSLIENNFGLDYTARFDGLNVAIAKDATANFTVKADIVATIPTTPVTYTVGITSSDAIRGIDGIGLNQYVYDTGTTYNRLISFNGTSQGTLNVVANVSTPLAGNVAVSTVNATTGITASVFDLQNTSKYDVTVKTVTATVGANSKVSAYYLYNGTTMLSAVGYNGTDTTITFSSLPTYVVAAGTTGTLTIKFDAVVSATGNVAVTNATVASAIDTGSNIVSVTTHADGNILALQSSGVIFTFVPPATNVATVAANTNYGYATGTIVFTVKANGVNLANLSDTTNTVIVVKDQLGATVTSSFAVSPINSALNDGGLATITVTAVKSASGTLIPVSFKIDSVTFSTATHLLDKAYVTGFDTFVTPTAWIQ